MARPTTEALAERREKFAAIVALYANTRFGLAWCVLAVARADAEAFERWLLDVWPRAGIPDRFERAATTQRLTNRLEALDERLRFAASAERRERAEEREREGRRSW